MKTLILSMMLALSFQSFGQTTGKCMVSSVAPEGVNDDIYTQWVAEKTSAEISDQYDFKLVTFTRNDTTPGLFTNRNRHMEGIQILDNKGTILDEEVTRSKTSTSAQMQDGCSNYWRCHQKPMLKAITSLINKHCL